MIREFPGVTLHRGDCLEVMPTIEAGSVDLILSDLPYGTTACKWYTVIPFEPLWACFKHVLKPRGAVVLTASQPFTSMLVMSNREWFKYCLVWRKSRPTDFFNAKNRPMRIHEDVVVFSSGTTANRSEQRMTYNPQGLVESPYIKTRRKPVGPQIIGSRPSWVSEYAVTHVGYPDSVIDIPSEHNGDTIHPTQKPVALFEYLIKTYSNEGETVLDATIGSGTTALAALNTGRRCIGIERDDGYFDIACRRVAEASDKTALLNRTEV